MAGHLDLMLKREVCKQSTKFEVSKFQVIVELMMKTEISQEIWKKSNGGRENRAKKEYKKTQAKCISKSRDTTKAEIFKKGST